MRLKHKVGILMLEKPFLWMKHNNIVFVIGERKVILLQLVRGLLTPDETNL